MCKVDVISAQNSFRLVDFVLGHDALSGLDKWPKNNQTNGLCIHSRRDKEGCWDEPPSEMNQPFRLFRDAIIHWLSILKPTDTI